MKLSCVCTLFLSVFIPMISSDKTTELENLTQELMKTMVSIIGMPIAEYVAEAPESENEIALIFNEAMLKIRTSKDQLEKEFLNSLTPEMKEAQKNVIRYLSVTLTKSYQAALKTAQNVTNKSFDALPNHVQKNILDTGLEIDSFLKKLKGKLDQIKPEGNKKKP